MRRGVPVSVADLVGGVVRKAPSAPGVVDEITWRRAVGVQVAKRTQPMRLERGVLTVKVASSAWAQELSLLEGTLRARLADLGIVVTQVRFRVGEVAPPQRLPGARVDMRRKRAPVVLSDEVLGALERVADDEVRAAIADAASHNLAWQRAVLATAAPLVSPALRSSAKGTAPSVIDPGPPPAGLRGNRGSRRGWGR